MFSETKNEVFYHKATGHEQWSCMHMMDSSAYTASRLSEARMQHISRMPYDDRIRYRYMHMNSPLKVQSTNFFL